MASLLASDSGDRSKPTKKGHDISLGLATCRSSSAQSSQGQDPKACYAYDVVGHFTNLCPHWVFPT